MQSLVKRYVEYLEMQNYSYRTYEYRDWVLSNLIDWLEERGISRFNDVTKPILERYRRHLYHSRGRNGKPMSAHMQHARLVPIRRFFRWLNQQNYILYNPASELELPKKPKALPKHPLSAEEAEIVINTANIETPEGLRDRAILEIFYSTGIRRMEMINLSRHDINESVGTLAVRRGKGMKDRFVPIGDRALLWLNKYLEEVRPSFVLEPDPHNIFLESNGQLITADRLSRLVRKYVEDSGTHKQGACHLFRHTVATIMLENGADIRFIQQMLGHANLATTEIYTRVAIHKLKEVHNLTHPARLHQDKTLMTAPEIDNEPDEDDILDALENENDAEDYV